MHFALCAMLGESSAHADRIMQNAPRRNVPLVALFQLERWFVSGCLRRSSVASAPPQRRIHAAQRPPR